MILVKSCNPHSGEKSGPSDKGFSMDIIEEALENFILQSSSSYTNILTSYLNSLLIEESINTKMYLTFLSEKSLNLRSNFEWKMEVEKLVVRYEFGSELASMWLELSNDTMHVVKFSLALFRIFDTKSGVRLSWESDWNQVSLETRSYV